MESITSIARMKREARNYIRLVKQDHGQEISYGKALEKVAFLNDFQNWDTASALSRNEEKDLAEFLSPLSQLVQFSAILAAVNSCAALSDIYKALINQQNTLAAAGWKKAEAVMAELYAKDKKNDYTLTDVFRCTELFDEQTLLIFDMSHRFGNTLDESCSHAIGFLRLAMNEK